MEDSNLRRLGRLVNLLKQLRQGELEPREPQELRQGNLEPGERQLRPAEFEPLQPRKPSDPGEPENTDRSGDVYENTVPRDTMSDDPPDNSPEKRAAEVARGSPSMPCGSEPVPGCGSTSMPCDSEPVPCGSDGAPRGSEPVRYGVACEGGGPYGQHSGADGLDVHPAHTTPVPQGMKSEPCATSLAHPPADGVRRSTANNADRSGDVHENTRAA